MSENKTYPGYYYQPLFDWLYQEYNITALESEMNDIIHVVDKMQGASDAIELMHWLRSEGWQHEDTGLWHNRKTNQCAEADVVYELFKKKDKS